MNSTELRLQAECFQWHWNTFPDQRKRLFMVHNNPRNAIDGNRLKAAGMVAGVADLQYLRPFKTPLFIEMKLPGETQSAVQIDFEALSKSIGCDYVVADSFERFKEVILNNQ